MLTFKSVSVYICVVVHAYERRCPLDALELKSQIGVSYLIWVLGTELGLSKCALCMLNCLAISSGLNKAFIGYI